MSATPIRCRGPWKIHKRSSESDKWLDEMGFFRKHTARDPSCLFRVVSENIHNTQRYFHKVRLDCLDFMSANKSLFEGSLTCSFDNYLKEMSNPSEWGGLIEISAMSHQYRRDFIIFEANKSPQTKICNGYGNTIYLFYSPETKHFDGVYDKEFINASSFCQSLVYEILYDRVYQLKDLNYAVEKMLHDKVPTNHIEYFMAENVERRKKQKERSKIFIDAANYDDKDKNNNALALKCKHHTEDLERASLLKESLSIFVFNRSLIQLENVCMNCLNVNSARDLLDNGITPFPYKVAKALDPDIYRNIEFDVWSELRRELRYGARYSDGTTLQVGVKCLCKLHEDQTIPYHCHIQEMDSDGGPCLVFIEELGEKKMVSYDQLESLPLEEVKPWAPPYRYSRTNSQFLTLGQMLQHIGNITRKQGISKTRTKSKACSEEPKSMDKNQNKGSPNLVWMDEHVSEAKDIPDDNFAYKHTDFLNFETMPVEVQAVPLMVDSRPGAHEMPHTHNGVQASDHSQPRMPCPNVSASGAGSEPLVPTAARAVTPSAVNTITTYSAPPSNNMGMVGGMGMGMGMVGGMGMGMGGYVCGVKPHMMWCPPHVPPHAPPPPPPSVNPNIGKSVQANGADLPMNDIPTLRYYFNLGVECMWASYGPPAAPHMPPRHYSPRDVSQEMQALSLQDNRGAHDHKHKSDKPPPHAQQPAKNTGQRPLLGPRFKRGNNQDGNQNNYHQNKGHNHKPPNNRRNSQVERPEGQEEGVVQVPYIPYPPPIYPMPYYQMEHDPAMMGMMGGMGYMGYEEGVEYCSVPYYPAPYPPAHPLPALPPHAHQLPPHAQPLPPHPMLPENK